MDLQEQLKALKELSSALDCKYETCINNIQELGMSSVVVYRELVEQFPGIKDMKEYGILFTGAQRNFVEKALEAKLREDKIVTVNRIPVPQGSPEIRLKDFQTKLLDNENKRSEESKRRRILVRLRSTVKYSTQNLESITFGI
ncbi:hypothetical protein MKW92_052664 [Papaver armeniacum]|nr:hypothetical protein MKW92_052664 [Papaver armeniacum]